MAFFDVRMRGFRARADVADVLRLLDARTSPLPSEPVALARLAGRVLAAPVVSPVSVPGFDRSAMDGYAVRATDGGARRVVGESLPGRPFAGTVESGQAVRIMTGAPVPGGADAVLPAEEADAANGTVTPRQPVIVGKHIARVGEDVVAGTQVLPTGRRLRPQDVGLLASIGIAEARVVRRPRVAVLVTGDELLPPGSVPGGFRVVDSNSPMLAALVARDGGECPTVTYLPDRYEAVRDAMVSADADVVLVSGGSSVGTEDHAPRALADVGELAIHGIAVRPAGPTGVGFLKNLTPQPPSLRGKGEPESSSPLRFGEGLSASPTPPAPFPKREGGAEPGFSSPLRFGEGPGEGLPFRPVFLLPGNPVSCLCAYDLFAGRAVRRLGGRPGELPYRSVTVPLAAKIISMAGRVDYVRVRLANGAAEVVASIGASNLSTATAADGFVLVDRDRAELAAGEPVQVWLYGE